jgi:glycosyltransferase involved in cell wall biosynthesis
MPRKLNLDYPKNSNKIIQKDLSYFCKTKDHRMYTGFLNYIKNNKADIAIFYRLDYPEYLLSDLKFFKKINSKIVIFTFGYELISKSPARSDLFVDLIKNKNISKCIVASILGANSSGPDYFEKKFNLIKKKIIKVSEPRSLSLKTKNLNKCLSRKKLKIKSKKFIILYLGQPYYGKGFDLFIKLIKIFKDKNILFYIQTNLKNINFNIKGLDNLNKNKNVILRQKLIKYNLIKYVYGAADAVLLPYRKFYKYGTSSIFLESILSSRPVIVPNFNPFKDILKKYKIGVLFNSENIKSMRRSVNYIFDNYNNFNFIEQKKKYLEFTDDYFKITNEIKKMLK